jgi:hypothetical protein
MDFEEDLIGKSNLKQFSVNVDKDEKDSLIWRVVVGPKNQVCGSCDNIYFVIRQSSSANDILKWDVNNDCELESFGTSSKSKIMFDS